MRLWHWSCSVSVLSETAPCELISGLNKQMGLKEEPMYLRHLGYRINTACRNKKCPVTVDWTANVWRYLLGDVDRAGALGYELFTRRQYNRSKKTPPPEDSDAAVEIMFQTILSGKFSHVDPEGPAWFGLARHSSHSKNQFDDRYGLRI